MACRDNSDKFLAIGGNVVPGVDDQEKDSSSNQADGLPPKFPMLNAFTGRHMKWVIEHEPSCVKANAMLGLIRAIFRLVPRK